MTYRSSKMVMRWTIHNTHMCDNDQWDKCNDLLSQDNIFFSQGSWKWGAPLDSLVSVKLEWKELCRWLLPHTCMCKVGLSKWFRPSVSQPVCQWNFETIFLHKGLDDLANPTRNIHRIKLCILVHVCIPDAAEVVVFRGISSGFFLLVSWRDNTIVQMDLVGEVVAPTPWR